MALDVNFYIAKSISLAVNAFPGLDDIILRLTR